MITLLTVALLLQESAPSTAAGWYEAGADTVLISYASDGTWMMYHFGEPPYAKRLDVIPPGAKRVDGPYRVIERSYVNEGVALSGTIFIPSGPGPHPGAVFIHGSGNSTRDNFWYVWIVNHLARNGIAVLLPDKRGTGKSAGNWKMSSFHDYAGDAAAGARALGAIERVDRRRIGVVGISQGGHIAPMVEDLFPDLAFAVNLSGSAVPLDQQLVLELTNTLRQQGWPRFLVPLVRPLAIRTAKNRQPEWWRMNGALDPIPHWQQLTTPALIVYGAEDEKDNVPVRTSVKRLQSIGRENLEIVVYPDSGHALYAPGTTRIRTDLLAKLVRFIHSATAP